METTDAEHGRPTHPAPPETAQPHPRDTKRHRSLVGYGWVVAAVSLVALLTAAAVTVAWVVRSTNKPNVPTARQHELSDYLATAVDPDTLLSSASSSPQAKAYDWLTRLDTVWADPSIAVTKEMAIQRYALAVFYFATHGTSSWVQKGNTNNTWLMGPECNAETSWAGITCSDSNQVHTLALDHFGLVGTIPSEIGLLSQLESLVLKHHPDLSGSVPKSLGDLLNLRQLVITHSSLAGSIPSNLYSLSRLEYINLESNRMTGPVSSGIRGLHALQTLVLRNNTFYGLIPLDHLLSLNLEFLALGSNSFVGTISDSIRDMKSLQYLYLDHTAVDGELPIALGGAINLQSINLDHTAVTGRIPAVIGRLRQLRYLSVQGCKLQGSIPGEINLLTNLKTLDLASNAFTGELPKLSALANLTSLSVAHNQLRGKIDMHFANLTSLEFLLLNDNAFSGPIPTSIGRPAGMTGSPIRGLYISNNKFNGTVDEAICGLVQLESFAMEDNAQVTGPLPSCLSKFGTV